jgi:hypothetical protein
MPFALITTAASDVHREAISTFDAAVHHCGGKGISLLQIGG